MSTLQRLVLASFETGLVTTFKQFLIEDDAFSTLLNAYVWRKQVFKKQGTQLLGRLERSLTSQTLGSTDGGGAFSGNIFTILGLNTSQPNASLDLSGLSIIVGAQTFVSPTTPNGTLNNGGGGTGTINYQTGAVTIQTNPVAASTQVSANFSYYPSLPSLGIEEYEYEKQASDAINFPDVVYFDQRYAYQYDFSPSKFFDVSFYKMASPRNPVTWSGENYEQFYSANFYNVMWVTNNKPGFHAFDITAISSGSTTTITYTYANAANFFSINDMVVVTGTADPLGLVNGKSGTVTSIGGSDPNWTVTINLNSTGFTYSAGGDLQSLTRSVAGQDGIRWYDGDLAGEGFVNFAPPLSGATDPSYLVGCRILIPFAGVLFAIGTFERDSTGNIYYYGNRARYCQLGTPFYNSLLPSGPPPGNQISAWYDTPQGFGGFFNVGSSEKIITAALSQETMIFGMEGFQLRVTSTGNSLDPFSRQVISPELGSESTHAAISLDRGVLSVGDFGYIMTTSYNSQRIDSKILQLIFEISQGDNGNQRVSGIRDWKNEWIYFTYPQQGVSARYPNRSIFFNYRENSFAVFKEQFTTYGYFRNANPQTWEDLGDTTWGQSNFTWGSTTLAERVPLVVGGNQQGYIQIKDNDRTINDYSHYIQNIVGMTITSPSHCLEVGDYIYITGVIGPVDFNDKIFRVTSIGDQTSGGVPDPSTFTVDGDISASIPYLGNGQFRILDNFIITTKMFPLGWQQGRGCRIGAQQYLFNTTVDGEVTVNIYTSTNTSTVVNDPFNTDNPFLIQSQIVRTRPDEDLGINGSTNQQNQIWHREYGSFMGDTIQLSLTLSDEQMRVLEIVSSPVVLQAMIIEFYTGSKVLA